MTLKTQEGCSWLKRKKTLDGDFITQEKKLTGTYIINICENTEIPFSCKDKQLSYIYFVYSKEDQQEDCLSLLPIDDKVTVRKIDEDLVGGFSLYNQSELSKFGVVVKYNPEFAYPDITLHYSTNTELLIQSKFSSGIVNEGARALEQEQYILCIFLMLFGLFLMLYGGISFEKYMLIIVLILVSVLVFFTLLTLFDFKFNSGITTIFWGICIGVGVAVKLIARTVKWLGSAVFAFFGGTVGFKLAEALFPDSYIYQKVN